MTNPVSESEIPVKRDLKGKKRAFTPEDVQAVLAKVPELGLIIRLGISIGMCKSESLARRCNNVDLINGTLLVEARLYRGDIDAPTNAVVLDKKKVLDPGRHAVIVGQLQAKFLGLVLW